MLIEKKEKTISCYYVYHYKFMQIIQNIRISIINKQWNYMDTKALARNSSVTVSTDIGPQLKQ